MDVAAARAVDEDIEPVEGVQCNANRRLGSGCVSVHRVLLCEWLQRRYPEKFVF
jgi:hypothetical protein